MCSKKYLIAGMLCTFPLLTIAKPSVNDMQMCQALLEFVEKRLDSPQPNYSPEEIADAKKGLKAYNNYIQKDIIAPGLLEVTKGDQSKADEYQKQINTFKLTVVKSFEKRYEENKIYTDQVVAINNCAKKAVPSGQNLEQLKKALKTLLALSQK